ncbi:hypothetical protein L6452_20405 [Arctium lappa]|uniref:Uncharacterized protein n=1 Tax=Arctium lappa TaxID=4217 RepID=A0ACB9BC26_ARCLA|nr:hypothetical protein L6452_20405 [Arctium lappa]
MSFLCFPPLDWWLFNDVDFLLGLISINIGKVLASDTAHDVDGRNKRVFKYNVGVGSSEEATTYEVVNIANKMVIPRVSNKVDSHGQTIDCRDQPYLCRKLHFTFSIKRGINIYSIVWIHSSDKNKSHTVYNNEEKDLISNEKFIFRAYQEFLYDESSTTLEFELFVSRHTGDHHLMGKVHHLVSGSFHTRPNTDIVFGNPVVYTVVIMRLKSMRILRVIRFSTTFFNGKLPFGYRIRSQHSSDINTDQTKEEDDGDERQRVKRRETRNDMGRLGL